MDFGEFHKQLWFVRKADVRTDYTVIENLSQFMAPSPPLVHPDHPDYALHWSWETKKCIEGVWGKEFGGYRYGPGNLYFFGNYGIIEHTLEDQSTKDIKPYIVDFIWDYAYDSLQVRGFSGWSKDEEFSSDYRLELYEKGQMDKKYLPPNCLTKDNKLKSFLDPRQNIEKIHSEPKGIPLFTNPTLNELVMGTRGSSKSYWVAIGEIEYRFIFCEAKKYDRQYIDGLLKTKQCVGSSEVDYSSDMLDKFLKSQQSKADPSNPNFVKWFGIWGKEGDKDFTPCPFYKKHKGNLGCPNKKNPYRHQYDVKRAGRFHPKGTGSAIFHVSYSDNKGSKGEMAASGGRYNFSNVEEVGLAANYVGIQNHNESTVKRGGRRFGVQWAQGTSGNIQYVQAAKKIFLNPQDYSTLHFFNRFGKEGKHHRTARFVPYYITLFQYKDENGNTDYDASIDHVNRERIAKSESDDPSVLREHLMNHPCYVSEMWLTASGYYLPYDEALVRERQLMEGNLYKKLMMSVELFYDDRKPYGVDYRILHDAEPITEWPIPKDMKDPTGCVVIYELPTPLANGKIPEDMYCFIGHDPYVEEDIDTGGSVGVTYILKNPKYVTDTGTGNIIVASYIGKPMEGLDKHYEIQEKLIQMYGNPIEGLWYEKNRGDHCREYYIKRNKLGLLALTPQITQGSSIKEKFVTSTGFVVGNWLAKVRLLKKVNDWLLETTELKEDGKKLNIFRIPCIFLIRQIMMFERDGNYDAVSAFIGCIVGLREHEAMVENEAKKRKNRGNPLGIFLGNDKIFRRDKIKNFRRGKDTGMVQRY